MSDEMVQENTEETNEETLVASVEVEPTSENSLETTDSPIVAAETVTEEPDQPLNAGDEGASEETVDEFAAAMSAYDTQVDLSLQQLQQDTVVEGTVMRIDREGILVDVGAKSEGIIRLNELTRGAGANFNPETIVKVGDKIRVFVLEAENRDGVPILSKKRADFELAWEKVQKSKELNETIYAIVSDRVKGGLVVDLGIRGFVPASHVGSGSMKTNLDKYIGQEIALKVLEVDKDRHKVVLSNKLAQVEEREKKSTETKNSLAPGQQRHGVVRRLTNYGAFVDLGGIDGLLHISEMSWTRINDPKEVLKEGQEIDVIILSMDLEKNRVSLGLRQILPDPWTEVPNRYHEGDIITGQVSRVVPFGAFIQLEGGIEAIVPSDELPRNKGGKGAVQVAVAEEITAKIIRLQPETRKMTLSMKALQPVEEITPPKKEEQPAATPTTPPASGGREKKGRGRDGDRERDDDSYNRYAPGRQDEPRFTLGDAFAAAKKERNKRDRRQQIQEEEEYDDDFEYEEGDEVVEEEPGEVETK